MIGGPGVPLPILSGAPEASMKQRLLDAMIRAVLLVGVVVTIVWIGAIGSLAWLALN